jgi:hypothetical protein
MGVSADGNPGQREVEERGAIYLSLVRRGEHPLAGCETPERPMQRTAMREPMICEMDAEKFRFIREDEMQGCLAFVPQSKRKLFGFPPHVFIRCPSNAGGARGIVLKVPVRFLDENEWGTASPTNKPYLRSMLSVIRNRLGLGEWEKITLTCKGKDIGGGLEGLTCNEIDAAVEKRQEGMCAAAKMYLESQGKHSWLARVQVIPPCAEDIARVKFEGVECSEPSFAPEDTPDIAWMVTEQASSVTREHGLALFAKAVRSTSPNDLADCAWLSSDIHPHIAPALCMAGPSLVFFACEIRAKLAPSWLPTLGCSAEEVHSVHLTMALHVARALEYMHRHGALHLDVRPGNIMV